jgi:hypothetical protein
MSKMPSAKKETPTSSRQMTPGLSFDTAMYPLEYLHGISREQTKRSKRERNVKNTYSQTSRLETPE